jgi:hypothetical protein
VQVALVKDPEATMELDVPQEVADTCAKWVVFTSKDVLDRIDSGV